MKRYKVQRTFLAEVVQEFEVDCVEDLPAMIASSSAAQVVEFVTSRADIDSEDWWPVDEKSKVTILSCEDVGEE